jgi:hypothetical protein
MGPKKRHRRETIPRPTTPTSNAKSQRQPPIIFLRAYLKRAHYIAISKSSQRNEAPFFYAIAFYL